MRMKNTILAILMVTPLAAWAQIDTTPAPAFLTTINHSVNQGVRYLFYKAWDMRDVPAGGRGNCMAIAYTKWKRLQEAGYGDHATIRGCYLSLAKVSHVYVVVDNRWMLDNDSDEVFPYPQLDCASKEETIPNHMVREWVNQHGDTGPLPEAARAAVAQEVSSSGQSRSLQTQGKKPI